MWYSRRTTASIWWDSIYIYKFSVDFSWARLLFNIIFWGISIARCWRTQPSTSSKNENAKICTRKISINFWNLISVVAARYVRYFWNACGIIRLVLLWFSSWICSCLGNSISMLLFSPLPCSFHPAISFILAILLPFADFLRSVIKWIDSMAWDLVWNACAKSCTCGAQHVHDAPNAVKQKFASLLSLSSIQPPTFSFLKIKKFHICH